MKINKNKLESKRETGHRRRIMSRQCDEDKALLMKILLSRALSLWFVYSISKVYTFWHFLVDGHPYWVTLPTFLLGGQKIAGRVKSFFHMPDSWHCF